MFLKPPIIEPGSWIFIIFVDKPCMNVFVSLLLALCRLTCKFCLGSLSLLSSVIDAFPVLLHGSLLNPGALKGVASKRSVWSNMATGANQGDDIDTLFKINCGCRFEEMLLAKFYLCKSVWKCGRFPLQMTSLYRWQTKGRGLIWDRHIHFWGVCLLGI